MICSSISGLPYRFCIRIALLLATLAFLPLASAGASEVNVPLTAPDKLPDDLTQRLNHRFLMLGEIHGTREAPCAAMGLCRLMSRAHHKTVLCLEIPADDQPLMDEVAKTGNLDPLQHSSFFKNCDDGRSSAAMADLILSASREGIPVFAIVPHTIKSEDDSEEKMAARLGEIASAHPGACVVVLAGNYHTRVEDIAGAPASSCPSMAQRLVRQGQDVFSVALVSKGGSAWYISSQGEPPVQIQTQPMEGRTDYVLSFQPASGHRAALICRRTEFSPPWLGRRPPAALSTGGDKELESMYEADQSERKVWPPSQDAINGIGERDRKRRAAVIQLLAAGALKTAGDYFHAAMIMQHGDEPSDFMLAHELAVVAGFKGHPKGRWLAAASWDRLLQRLGKAQRFGTQYRKTGKEPWTMEPLEKGLPDSLRSEYCVPTLEESRKLLEDMNSKP